MSDIRQACRWHVFPDIEALQERAAQEIARAANAALAERGAFHLVLAGGNTPRGVYERLPGVKTNWLGWHIYFGDERCLPPDHPERNSSMASSAWLRHIDIPRMQIFAMPGELGSVRGAKEYAKALRGVSFDLVLLGLGEDGHTASLFPGHEWGARPDAPAVLPVHHAPKPPPERISLSAHRLSQARQVLFLVTGASKREAVRRWRAGETIPAGAVAPRQGVDVFVEEASMDTGGGRPSV